MNVSKRAVKLTLAAGVYLLLRRLLSLSTLFAVSGLTGLFGSSASSVGIIGGADGPTAVFVTGRPAVNFEFIMSVLLFAADLAAIILILINAIRALKKPNVQDNTDR